MRKCIRAALAMAVVGVVAVALSAGASASTGQGPTLYSVAFNNPNGLPANVDQIVANAGGTIVTADPRDRRDRRPVVEPGLRLGDSGRQLG